ncbi:MULTISPECIES: SRPBCC domain-containing protein [unclassified Agrococcus]|uniref:SRPBCC domain-containing protein n=1 Tax=unclassified Agrococcus TaxID=2615065 RepID=UPI00360CCF87
MDADDTARTPDAPTAETDAPAAGADHVRLELHVSRSRAYDAYVRDFGQWWQHGRTPRTVLHVEQHAGGAIVEHAVGGDETHWGDVLDVEVGSRIRHSYRHAGEHHAVVTAEFSDGEHGGAVVDIRHEPWEGSDEEREALQQAWTQALRRLTDDASSV